MFVVQLSKTPAYFTEYCRLTYELTRFRVESVLKSSSHQCLGRTVVSEFRLNPFRSPVRIFDTQGEIPRFSNAIIFHLCYD